MPRHNADKCVFRLNSEGSPRGDPPRLPVRSTALKTRPLKRHLLVAVLLRDELHSAAAAAAAFMQRKHNARTGRSFALENYGSQELFARIVYAQDRRVCACVYAARFFLAINHALDTVKARANIIGNSSKRESGVPMVAFPEMITAQISFSTQPKRHVVASENNDMACICEALVIIHNY